MLYIFSDRLVWRLDFRQGAVQRDCGPGEDEATAMPCYGITKSSRPQSVAYQSTCVNRLEFFALLLGTVNAIRLYLRRFLLEFVRYLFTTTKIFRREITPY